MVLRLLCYCIIILSHFTNSGTEQNKNINMLFLAPSKGSVDRCIDSIHNYISCYIYPIIVISTSNGRAGCALISTVSSCITDGLCNLGESEAYNSVAHQLLALFAFSCGKLMCHICHVAARTLFY